MRKLTIGMQAAQEPAAPAPREGMEEEGAPLVTLLSSDGHAFVASMDVIE